MDVKISKIHEANGLITLIELNTFANCLPVKDETYSRIIYTLMISGQIKILGKNPKNA